MRAATDAPGLHKLMAMSEVPIILTPTVLPTRIRFPARLLALVIALGCLAILCVAAYLAPNRAGTSTHTALGFHPCAFLQTTHIPCPTCGMTTAASWFVRGHFVASLYTQPAGFVFAGLVAVAFWVALYIAVSARPSYRLLTRLPTNKLVIGLLLFAALSWGWKILIHLRGIDGW